MKRILALLIAAAIPAVAQNSAPVDTASIKSPVKLACVGDSITQGVGATPGMAWPDQIAKLLGEKWSVKNFGVSGTTLLKEGDHPYQKTDAFKNAIEFLPDVVVILLGTNDTKPQNWKLKDRFVPDYIDLITQFSKLPSKPRVFICHPPYISGDGNWGINEAVTKEEIPLVDEIARTTRAGIIGVHAATDGKDALVPDKVHPNNDGAAVIARTVYQSLTGKPAAEDRK